ncbi:MAG: SLC13 family permease, partial [Rubricoccaceae bacterium]|nr:SLC13 family permease [Rubricoccaceae bacterium]
WALGFLDKVLQPRSSNIGVAIFRLMLPTTLLSGVISNTPIVAMLIPRIRQWARSSGIPASKLLIPLSTAAIVGGWLTLIGTSTNIVVHGLLLIEGYEGFGFFDLTWVGVPAAIVVVLYYSTIGRALLPDRTDHTLVGRARDYQFELRVAANASFAGKTVEVAGLRMLGNAYLARLHRDDAVRNVRPETMLLPDDVLTFIGDVEAHDLLLQRDGLERSAPRVHMSDEDLPLVEAVVSSGSHLVGKTLKEINFREQYGGVVIGIQQRGESVDGALGRVPLQAGDVLLIEGKPALATSLAARTSDFAFVIPLSYERPVASKASLSLLILAVMIGVVATGVMSLAVAAFIAALCMIATGCLRKKSIQRSIDFSVLLTIAAALGIGSAVETTGLAEAAATVIVQIAGAVGPVVMLVVLYAVANGLAELITNKASAVLMLPIALSVANTMGVDWKAFAIAITIGSAASFLTPIGYQTNLMVMGAGGYKYTDYTRAGAPVSVIVMIVTVFVCSTVWL